MNLNEAFYGLTGYAHPRFMSVITLQLEARRRRRRRRRRHQQPNIFGLCVCVPKPNQA